MPIERKWADAQQDVLGQQARGYGLAQMPELQAYLNGLLARIKTASGVPDWPGSVYILATPSLDAYSTAAGNIFLSPSWVSSAESEDELVALLSHEFGHIYLHYHQIADVVEGTDQIAQIAGVFLTLLKSKAIGNLWTSADSLFIAYDAGKGLGVGFYGRAEEIAADNFGLNICLRLGYSYTEGIKVFLERIASWDEINSNRRQSQKEQLRATTQQQSKVLGGKNKRTGKITDPALQSTANELRSGIAMMILDLKGGINDGVELVTAKHPDINARIERQASATENISDAVLSKDPVVASLIEARKRPSTAKALQNYQWASKVFQDVSNKDAVEMARKAASGPTANHAMPLIALYLAQGAVDKNPSHRSKQRVDQGKVLELNFNSPADRAWKAYVVRAQQFQASGDITSATKTIDAGLSVFRKAPEAWPQAIQFYGQTKSWKIAKNMEKECTLEHKSMESACRAAAVSPAEQAETDRKSKSKSDKAVDQWLKKKN